MIRLTIESRLENVSLIGGAVRGVAEMLSMEAANCYHLELCVVEAVTNVIKHAYHFQAGHWVEVEIAVHRDRLIFKISDTGESMDESKAAPLRFDPSKVETLPEGGMGVFIVRSLMDEARYEVVDGRNVLTLTKHLKPEEHPE